MKCGSSLPEPWLMPLKYCFFLFIKFRLMGLPRRLGRRRRILRACKIMGSVSWPSSHVFLPLFRALFIQGRFAEHAGSLSAAPRLTFTPVHTYGGCVAPIQSLLSDNGQVGLCLRGPSVVVFMLKSAWYLHVSLNGSHYYGVVQSKLGIRGIGWIKKKNWLHT